MRAWLCAATIGLPLLGGCETLDGTWSEETASLISEDGIEVYYDHMIEESGGASWFQFKASNASEEAVCVTVTLDASSATSGHRMGGIYKLAPGDTVDVGYINDPSDWNADANAWWPDSDGDCGSGPPT